MNKKNGNQQSEFLRSLTPTERRILSLLSDGESHSYEEVHSCLGDDMAGITAVRFHVSNLRKKLEDRRCVILGGQGVYCMVRAITTAER